MKLESLYVTKFSQVKCTQGRNSLHTKTLTYNIDEFKKIISKFKSLEDKLRDENEVYVFPNSNFTKR